MEKQRRRFVKLSGLAGIVLAGSGCTTPQAIYATSEMPGRSLARAQGRTQEFHGTGGDDTLEINGILQRAAGGSLIVTGTSRISAPIGIPSDTTLVGVGAVWKWPHDWSRVNPPAMIVLDDVRNVVIDGLEIDGEHHTADHHGRAVSAIVIGAVNHVVIRNCYIHDLRGPDEPSHWASGISMQGNATDVTIEKNTIRNVQRNCISTWANAGTSRNTAIRILNNRLIKPRIRNCVLVSSSPDAHGAGDVLIFGNELAEATPLYAIRLSGPMNSVISNNHFRDNAGCINRNPLHGHRVIISGNLMTNTRGDVIHLNDSGHDANSTVFEHNIIEDVGGYLLRYLPRLTKPDARRRSVLTIMGNITRGGTGFRFTTDANQGPDACQIQMIGNVIGDTHDSAIIVQGINRPLISGNRIDSGRASGGPGIRITGSVEPMVQGNLITGFPES